MFLRISAFLFFSPLYLPALFAKSDLSTQAKTTKEVYETVWQRIYGGKEDDVADAVVALENGEAAIAGTCKSFDAKRTDICVLRMRADGQMRWRVMLGGKKKEQARAIARSSDGNLLVLGHSKSFAQNYDYDLYVAKVSLEGNVLWEKTFGQGRDEIAGGIVGTDDGGAMVVGTSESYDSRGMKEIYIVKLDKNGNAQRIRHLGGDGNDGARSITRTLDGRLVMAGYHETTRPGDYDFFVAAMTQHGDFLWTRSFGGEYEDELNDVAATPDGGVVVTGSTRSYGSSQTDLTVMKLDRKGNTVWHKLYGFKYYEYGNGIAVTSEGNVMVVGGTNTLGKGNHSVYTLVLSPSGKLLWSHIYGGERRDVANDVTRLDNGSMLVAGWSESFKRNKSFYLIKIEKAR